MASINRQKTGTLTTIASTELNSLANNAGATGAEFDNSAASALWPLGSFELFFNSAGTPTAGVEIHLYLLVAMDGTNYTDADLNAVQSMYVGSFVSANSTNDQRLAIMNRQLPPFKFKPYLVNRSGQAFAASSNTLKVLPSTMEIAAS